MNTSKLHSDWLILYYWPITAALAFSELLRWRINWLCVKLCRPTCKLKAVDFIDVCLGWFFLSTCICMVILFVYICALIFRTPFFKGKFCFHFVCPCVRPSQTFWSPISLLFMHRFASNLVWAFLTWRQVDMWVGGGGGVGAGRMVALCGFLLEKGVLVFLWTHF